MKKCSDHKQPNININETALPNTNIKDDHRQYLGLAILQYYAATLHVTPPLRGSMNMKQDINLLLFSWLYYVTSGS